LLDSGGHLPVAVARNGGPSGGLPMEKKAFVMPTLKEEASLAEVTLFSVCQAPNCDQ
jgi:hypothetical protein